MQAHQLSSLRRVMVLMAVTTFALFAMAACGGDDNDAPAASDPPTQAPVATATTEPTVIPAPTAKTVFEPPESPMTPATIPEPGSDEAQIMAVIEKQVIAVNTADYESFLETCSPSTSHPTIRELKFIYEENWGAPGPPTFIRFSPQGYNVRNVEVKMLRAPFAQATFHIYDYEQHMGLVAEGDFKSPGIVTQTYEKVDGQWYSETIPCSVPGR